MKKCLIVVDYQRDFVDGALGFSGAELLDERIVEKIREYRSTGGDIIFTFDTHKVDYLETAEGKKLPIPHCIEGTDGHKLYGKTADELTAADKCIYKPGFGSSELCAYLTENPYDRIELCGLVTDICVLSNAVIAKAACPMAEVYVDARCTATASKESYNRALDALEVVQVNIIGRNI